MQPRMRSSQPAGFTLIEILVGIAVSSLVILLSASVTDVAMKSWARDSERLRNTVEARTVLETFTKDLRAAIFRQSGTEWFRLTYDESIGNSTHYQIPRAPWLRFFVPAPDRDETPGTLTAVSYRMAYDDPVEQGGNYPVFGLYRMVTDPLKTHEEAMGTPETVQKFWLERQLATKAPENFLGSHLIRFDTVLWYWAPDRQRGRVGDRAGRAQERVLKRVPSGTELRVVGMRVETAPAVPDFTHVSQWHAVDVNLTVLTQRGIRALEGGSLSPDEIVERFGYHYGERIELLTQGACLP